MSANTVLSKEVTVGTTQERVSAWDPNREWTKVQALSTNTDLIYIGGDGVTTAAGFGEVIAKEGTEIKGPAAVYLISGSAGQKVRVLEGYK